jgi:hypothetical protein
MTLRRRRHPGEEPAVARKTRARTQEENAARNGGGEGTRIRFAPPVTPTPDAPPAYFLSLAVENFRSFGSRQTLDLSDGNGRPAVWTIILGENGTGKTTLLQCLAALEPQRLDKELVVTRLAIGRLGTAGGLRLLDFFADGIRAEGHLHAFTASVAYGGRLSQHQSTMKRVDLLEWNRSMPWYPEEILGLQLNAYGANRRMGSGAISESRNSDACASLFFDDATLINAEEWLLQADYAARVQAGSTTANVWRDQVKSALIRLLPDVTDLRFTVDDSLRPSPRVEAKTPYGWVRLRDLSLGYRTLIAWMVDLASRLFDRYPNSENPLAEPAIVLVDEIDLHLHPRWQRTIMAYLSNLFPNTQFVATAHSPLVVQSAVDANIVVLRREGDHVVIDNDPANVRNWRVDQILTSELFGLESARSPYLDRLLAEREAILGKGTLTARDEARLREIGAEIGDLPTGETPADIEAMDVIRLAAARLKQLNGDAR